MTSHCVSSVRSSSNSVLIVNPPITASSAAGMAMNVYSITALPCDCSGIGWPRSLKRMTQYRTAAKTSTPTMPAMRNTHHWRSWIIWAFSPSGCHVSCGASLAHDERTSIVPTAASGAPRRRRVRTREERSDIGSVGSFSVRQVTGRHSADGSERAPASEWPAMACVAGERRSWYDHRQAGVGAGHGELVSALDGRAREREDEREELGRAGLAERRADPLGASGVVVVVDSWMHLDHEPRIVVALVVEHDVGGGRARHREACGRPVVAREVVPQPAAVEDHGGGDARLVRHVLAGELVGLRLLGPALVLLGDVARSVVSLDLAFAVQPGDGAARDERHGGQPERAGERCARDAAPDPDDGAYDQHDRGEHAG